MSSKNGRNVHAFADVSELRHPCRAVFSSAQMFAVEVLDNIVNLAAIFYAVHARPKFFHPRPKSLSQLLDSASSGNTSSSLMGSFGGNVPFGGNSSFGGSRSVGAYRGRRWAWLRGWKRFSPILF